MNNKIKNFCSSISIFNKKQNGFTLLEVLIALVIISVGLLGFAGLQIQSLQASTGSYQRDRATHLADDIIQQMRANRAAAVAGLYNQPTAGTLEIQDVNCTTAVGCVSSASLASDDLFFWGNSVRGTANFVDRNGVTPTGLVNGAGVVCIDGTPNDLGLPAPSPGAPQCNPLIGAGAPIVYAVKIWWGPDNDTNNVAPSNDGIPDGIPDFIYVATHQP